MDSKNIDIFYDYIDEAAMLIYQDTHLPYLQALVRAIDGLVGNLNDSMLSMETIGKLDEIYDELAKINFLNEEVRIAFELLVIKGLKDSNKYPLDMITPDAIGYLFSNIVNRYTDENDLVLDIGVGTGNLIYTIHNYSEKKLNFYGIEKDELLCNLSRVSAEAQAIDINIFCNDALDGLGFKVNMIVCDIVHDGSEEYLPYKILDTYVNNLEDDGLFMFLIDNDFFSQPNLNDFKTNFVGSLLGLIVLPETMFKSAEKCKSVLIGSKKKIDDDILIVNFPSLKDEAKVKETIEIINEWIEKLKGIVK